MTIPTWSTRAVLFGEDNREAQRQLTNVLDAHNAGGLVVGGARLLTAPARKVVRDQLASVGTQLVDLDLGDFVVLGWRRHRALIAAAKRTLEHGSHEDVAMASHRIECKHQPYVDVLVDERRVARVTFDLAVQLVLDGVVLVVRGGRITEIRAGSVTVTASLSIEKVPLPPRTRSFALVDVVKLSTGIRLLPGAHAAPARELDLRSTA